MPHIPTLSEPDAPARDAMLAPIAASLIQTAVSSAHADIHNPLAEVHGGRAQSTARLFSTHPATEERVRKLRANSPARVRLA